MRIEHTAFVFLVAPLCFHQVLAVSPPVKVALQSSWPAAPPLVEILESISLQNETSFFPLLDSLTDTEILSSPSTLAPEAIHNHAVQIALLQGALPDSAALSYAEMYLALHAATPKIEAYYQHYNDRQKSIHGDVLSRCGSWVDWYGEVACDIETLQRLVDADTIGSGYSNRPKLLSFDHIWPSPNSTPPIRTAILYASLDSSNFRALHSRLFALASKPHPRIEYVLRYVTPASRDVDRRAYLSGYGVVLDLKKMDYLALDDRNQRNSDDKVKVEHAMDTSPEENLVPTLLQKHTENEDFDSKSPLTPEELSDIGIQAAQLILDSPNSITTLKHLSQDFPKYAVSVAKRVIPTSKLREEVMYNSHKVQPGLNAIWLNGASIPETKMNPFSLLKLLRKETEIMSSLISAGLTARQAVDLVSHPAIGSAQGVDDVLKDIFDASDRFEGGGVIVWWNDIEKDSRYANWTPTLRTLLRPMYPGQFHNVKRNMFNVVLAVDLSQLNILEFISTKISTIINRGFPFRFGVVPMTDTEEGARMARLLYKSIEIYGRASTMTMFQHIHELSGSQSTVDWSVVRSEFDKMTTTKEDLKTDYDSIIGGTADVPLAKARSYAKRMGVDSKSNHAFINGKYIEVDDIFLRHMQAEVETQLLFLQEQVYTGRLDDSIQDMSVFFYDLPSSAKRRNLFIHPANKPGRTLRVFALDTLFRGTCYQVLPGSYIYADIGPADQTVYIVADFDSESGRHLLRDVLTSLNSESSSRVAFVHNPVQIPDSGSDMPTFSSFISHMHSRGLFSNVTPSRILRVLGLESRISFDNNVQIVISKEEKIEDLTGGVFLKDISRDAYLRYIASSRSVADELGLKAGEQALIVNGRVVGPFGSGDIDADDFVALEAYELAKRTSPVVEALEDVLGSLDNHDRDAYSELVSVTSSIISTIQLPDPDESILHNNQQRTRNRRYRSMEGNYTSFQFGNDSTALLHFGVVVDPLSEAAQKWSSLLEWLLAVPSVFVDLRIHPSQYRDVPLKRFYRYNVNSAPSYDENGQESLPQTVFNGLPLDPIYTLGMDVPQSWLVRPREAKYDLDNIQLKAIANEDREKGLEAVFHLDYLIVEGHTRDTLTQIPPRGLQLQLTDGNSTPIADTQVVANLGYVQFRAKPGVFKLEIRPGRGRGIYTMESVGNEGWDSPSVDIVGNEIALTSFEGLTLYPRLARVPGMEDVDVLPTSDPVQEPESFSLQNLPSWFSSIFHKKEDTIDVTNVPAQADINIFTVASGLLYERFASIMILSVLRNTNSTVKFWFIENFLSPSFLEFIPHFAEEYGFQYELVTYKWPSWLRTQKEKQRVIWAYKILFLDVLFPMDLEKVIFVDADQIVRADLKELVDLNLHGAPYGYTPMGDDNLEMEGFRFWKTGYWAQFLQGLPYHISALYVVDLVRFRQIAAGDILRGHYQQLSADPNSLANLDQDLPNNLQRDVPIFSLPEDWLWCETWCSKDRLARAKTIDLCQNPLTKEPKLSRARKIPEWEEYDAEIARFAHKLSVDGRVRSDIAAADSNVLANVVLDAAADSAASDAPPTTPSSHVEEEKAKGNTRATGQVGGGFTSRDEL